LQIFERAGQNRLELLQGPGLQERLEKSGSEKGIDGGAQVSSSIHHLSPDKYGARAR
jgi:hypothetical protein